MAQQRSHLLLLPQELQVEIVNQLDVLRDVSSVAQLNRHFRRLFFDYLFDFSCTKFIKEPWICWLKHDDDNPRTRELSWCRLVLQRAMITNSSWIAEQVTVRREVLNLTERLPEVFYYDTDSWGPNEEADSSGYLHCALTADAPHVVIALLKAGVDMSHETNKYPELTPLYLTLSMSRTSTQNELDASLQIACSNVLPRTVAHLLARGANPNASGSCGLNAVHCLLIARWPRIARDFAYCLQYKTFLRLWEGLAVPSWKSFIPTILTDLLAYGSDIHLPTQTTPKHRCHPGCWSSDRCSHQGATPLHLVAASKISKTIPLLLENGANPDALDGDGYTPLYEALRRGNKTAVHTLLGHSRDKNPIVHVPRRSTALHIACRFAYTHVVNRLLRAGVSANVLDGRGETPLHEVLSQKRRNKCVVKTLLSLSRYGANPDISTSPKTPRELAKSHPNRAVRELFDPAAQLHNGKALEPADQHAKATPTAKVRAWKNKRKHTTGAKRPPRSQNASSSAPREQSESQWNIQNPALAVEEDW
ncbi:ankyrin repeat-containing domain protein [Xylaria arbuscula]|nr:ankyrin repeat-containing domain protein [Xylaria arbuscula]